MKSGLRLIPILSFSSLIKENMYDSVQEELKEAFHVIENGGNRIIRTVDAVLNMAELQVGSYSAHMKPLRLDVDVLDKLEAEYKHLMLSKKLEYVYKKMDKAVFVNGDSYSITQIFGNLIDNAIKYTSKGKIEVEIYEKGENIFC